MRKILLFAGCAAILSVGDDSEGAAPEQKVTEQEAAPAEDAPADEAAVDEAAVDEEEPAAEAPAEEADVAADHTSALTSAETYSDLMDMSKQGIFDQLTSEGGGQFTAEQAGPVIIPPLPPCTDGAHTITGMITA